jgi:hypothetical protein
LLEHGQHSDATIAGIVFLGLGVGNAAAHLTDSTRRQPPTGPL